MSLVRLIQATRCNFGAKHSDSLLALFNWSKSLDSHSDDSLLMLSGPDDRNHLDAGTSAVCRHSFDRFDDSFQQVTDKCQTGRLSTLHSRGHLDANPGVTTGEILTIFRKKSG